jgi:hypothetical protein
VAIPYISWNISLSFSGTLSIYTYIYNQGQFAFKGCGAAALPEILRKIEN